MLKLRYIYLVVAVLLFAGCGKEYSTEGQGPSDVGTSSGTAEYNFTGSPGTCSAAVVAGTYRAGTALTVANSVTISVNVTKVGTYLITTGSADGFTFYSSGTFTATGNKTIKFTGTGVPQAAGSFNFIPGPDGCSFKVDVAEGSSGGTAVFSLKGAPGACTNAVVSGTYVVGTALNFANTVLVEANVTTTGTYSIATTLINGISFASTGSFSSTGQQFVILKGSGTPIAAGNFSFKPGVDGCSYNVPVTGGTPPPTYTYYYEATIDGVVYKETVTATNDYEVANINSGFGDDMTFGSIINPSTSPRPANTTYLSVEKGVFHNFSSSTNVQFKDFFSPAPYPFGTPGGDGVVISWGDKDGNEWTTANPPGTQSSSLFTITAVEELPVIGGIYALKVTATFYGKLYDLSGNSKTVTGGKFVGYFEKL